MVDFSALPAQLRESLSGSGPSAESWLYGSGTLAGVMPLAASSLGVRLGDASVDTIPSARHVVVVMVDGLGWELLTSRGGHAPFLRAAMQSGESLRVGFPTSTSISVTTLGTGVSPGAHGVVGIDVLNPHGSLFSTLNWENGPDPRSWQPQRTVFETVAAHGVEAVCVGPSFFAGSGLTEASMRGGRVIAAPTLAQRVDAAVAQTSRPERTLTYLYWGELDKVGHVHGCGSWQWGGELEAVDGELRRLVAQVSSSTMVLVTGDHGMVDVPDHARIDVAHEPSLQDGVLQVGGDPRCAYAYCRPGAVAHVQETWAARLGPDAVVVTQEQLRDAGWWGPVRDGVAGRIGDVIAVMVGDAAVVDSRRMRPELLRLRGLHGSVTPAELLVPLLVWPSRATLA